MCGNNAAVDHPAHNLVVRKDNVTLIFRAVIVCPLSSLTDEYEAFASGITQSARIQLTLYLPAC